SSLIFFLTPPPPYSSLFPYTTLFRSDIVPCPHCQHVQQVMIAHARKSMHYGLWVTALLLLVMGPLYTLAGLVLLSSGSLNSRAQDRKSNTSELQSPYDLVCRLLLEKK